VAEQVEEVADLVDLGGHPLKVGERARRGLTGAEQAYDPADLVFIGLLEATVQACLVEAPVPILRGAVKSSTRTWLLARTLRISRLQSMPAVMSVPDTKQSTGFGPARPCKAFFTSSASA
jgi:hypothetical protein